MLTLGADRVDIFFGMVGILNFGKIVQIPAEGKILPKSSEILTNLRCSLTHLGCTRLIKQMRKNANFPMKIGAIKACITLGNDSLAHRE